MPCEFIRVRRAATSKSNAKCNSCCHDHAFCSRLSFSSLSRPLRTYFFGLLMVVESLNRSLTVSCKNSTKLLFFFSMTVRIGSHLWLHKAQRNSGVPPLRRSTCTHSSHMISRQCVHLYLACACECRGQIIAPSGKTTGGLGRGRSYSGITTCASVDSTNNSTSPSVTVWPASRRASLMAPPLRKQPLVESQSRRNTPSADKINSQ